MAVSVLLDVFPESEYAALQGKKNLSTVQRFSYSNVIHTMKISIKDRVVLMTNSVLAQGS